MNQRALAAEFVGTFMLMSSVLGAAFYSFGAPAGAAGILGVAFSIGFTVMALAFSIGHISGGHFNPAVTLGFCLARRFPLRQVVPYILSQCIGALLASALLRLLFPTHANLGATVPAGPALQSFVLEIVLTLVLMFVILSVSTGAKEKGLMAVVAVGSVIGLEALFAGPISGASMNPARSLAPALVSGNLASLWVYLAAPVLGAGLAIPLCLCIQDRPCCCAQAREACP